MERLSRPALFLIGAIIVVGAAVVLLRAGARPFPAVGIPFGIVFLAWHRSEQRRREVEAERRSRGLCPTCGYDLAGIAGGPCPKCGRATEVRGTTGPLSPSTIEARIRIGSPPVIPAEYAPPTVPRRGRFAAGVFAYLIACYGVSVGALALRLAAGRFDSLGVNLVVTVLFPLMFPFAIFLMALEGKLGAKVVVETVVMALMFAAAYRYFRRAKPSQTAPDAPAKTIE